MPPAGLVTRIEFVKMATALSIAELLLLKIWSSPVAVKRFSSNPLVEEEWLSTAPFSRLTLRKAWRPSIVSVQLVTAMSWPSKLVLLMPMTVSLVNVAACAMSVASKRAVMGARRRIEEHEFFISEELERNRQHRCKKDFRASQVRFSS